MDKGRSMTKERVAVIHRLVSGCALVHVELVNECLVAIEQLQAEKERMIAALYPPGPTVGITQQESKA
jgi:hypothetical protein